MVYAGGLTAKHKIQECECSYVSAARLNTRGSEAVGSERASFNTDWGILLV